MYSECDFEHLMFVSYYFWLKRQRCLYDANAFVGALH